MKKMLSVITALSVLSPTLVAAEEAAKASFPAKVAGNACSVGGGARLTVAKGKVLLSRGGSFSEIRDGAALSVGDRILVREGSASVVVGQNVVSRVGAGSMLTITEKDGAVCAAQVSPNPAVVAADYYHVPVQPVSEFGAFDPFWLGAGALGLGAGIGLGVGISNNNGNGGQGQNAALLLLAGVSH
jgi:hypothetical protein